MRFAFSEKRRRLKNAAGSGSPKSAHFPGFGQFGLLKAPALSKNQAKNGENVRQRARRTAGPLRLRKNNIKTISGRVQAIRGASVFFGPNFDFFAVAQFFRIWYTKIIKKRRAPS